MPSLAPINRLLAALRPELWDRDAPHLDRVYFKPGEVLAPADETVSYVLFIDVRRPSLTLVARVLQRAGLISYRCGALPG